MEKDEVLLPEYDEGRVTELDDLRQGEHPGPECHHLGRGGSCLFGEDEFVHPSFSSFAISYNFDDNATLSLRLGRHTAASKPPFKTIMSLMQMFYTVQLILRISVITSLSHEIIAQSWQS